MPKLEQQAIAHKPGKAVVVAQLWSGLPIGRDGKPRWAVVLVTNGLITPGGRTGTEAEAKHFYQHVAHHFAEHPLTEQRAREILAEHGVDPAHCPTCACILPIGGQFCVACGRPCGVRSSISVGRPAPGSRARPIAMAPLHIR